MGSTTAVSAKRPPREANPSSVASVVFSVADDSDFGAAEPPSRIDSSSRSRLNPRTRIASTRSSTAMAVKSTAVASSVNSTSRSSRNSQSSRKVISSRPRGIVSREASRFSRRLPLIALLRLRQCFLGLDRFEDALDGVVLRDELRGGLGADAGHAAGRCPRCPPSA